MAEHGPWGRKPLSLSLTFDKRNQERNLMERKPSINDEEDFEILITNHPDHCGHIMWPIPSVPARRGT